MNECFEDPCKKLIEVFKEIYLNSERPENHNIRFKSAKQRTVEVYERDNEGVSWKVKDKTAILSTIYRKTFNILHNYIVKYKDFVSYEHMLESDKNIIDKKILNLTEYTKQRYYYTAINQMFWLLKEKSMSE